MNYIPANEMPLLHILREQKLMKLKGGIYHRTQVDFTYNSNHIEGSRLTHDQTRYIFETNTIGITNESINIDDIIETTNHFRCIDLHHQFEAIHPFQITFASSINLKKYYLPASTLCTLLSF